MVLSTTVSEAFMLEKISVKTNRRMQRKEGKGT